ncbi:MAG: DUF3365 domain-containing protein [Deltaproteobacteria bacterium]|nr:DUF3365 domain-containing protein [Deltaproteobacteria bacterium]
MKKMMIYFLALSIVIIGTQASGGTSEERVKSKAKKVADQITELRSERAASLLDADMKITPDLFKSVCGPVKKKAMEIAKKEGLKIRHAAIKNRNPAHEATEEDVKLHDFFSSNPDKKGLWEKVTLKDRNFVKYSRPVYVEKACLNCHGEKEKRPEFIKKKYPRDKAYGFKVGHLRGIIQVMVPISE